MDIQQAKDQIRGAVRAYLSRDSHGLPRIPFHMQRPLLVMGPPGVGKTAAVAQVASELGINFVSYSITHHTRQTALGLPFIVQREYGGRAYSVSEYTMSEIIGAVHDAMARTGVREGILFLDEVNCVSETLAPAMLQFLQYKTFGQHRLPEGWVIVTAGNPSEYNRSAREFDPAMLDRLKRLDVEPDLQVWLDYAGSQGVHPAVLAYVQAKPAHFYRVRAGVSGMRLVTARGWEDLSRMLLAYEAEGLPADEALVAQYLQDEEVAQEFFIHYELFCTYRNVYRVDEILDADVDATSGDAGVQPPATGEADDGDGSAFAGRVARAAEAALVSGTASAGDSSDELPPAPGGANGGDGVSFAGMVARAAAAPFDERMALVGLLGDAVASRVHESVELEQALRLAREDLVALRPQLQEGELRPLDERVEALLADETALSLGKNLVGDANVVRAERLRVLKTVRRAAAAAQAQASGDLFEAAKGAFNAECAVQTRLWQRAAASMENAYRFLDCAFGAESQEALVATTRLSADAAVMHHVAQHGGEAFLAHNKGLLIHDRTQALLAQLA